MVVAVETRLVAELERRSAVETTTSEDPLHLEHRATTTLRPLEVVHLVLLAVEKEEEDKLYEKKLVSQVDNE